MRASRLLFALILLVSLGKSTPTQATPAPFPNSGFETPPAGSPGDWDWPASDWVRDNTEAHSGTYSARVSRSSGSATSKLWSPHIPVQSSTVYTLTYWLRAQDATPLPTVDIHQYTNDDEQTGPRLYSRMDVGDGDKDWFQVSCRFQTMPDADYMRVRIYLWTDMTGTFWFDDFALDEGPLALYPLQSGFPVVASNNKRVVFASPVVADIDHDGDNELLIGNNGGLIDGWDYTGAPLPNFPLVSDDRRIIGPLALADLDGDQDLEIVAGTETPDNDGRGRVFVWHHTGSVFSGWPQSVEWLGQYGTDRSKVKTVALADIDGDSDLEVLAGTTNGAPNYSGSDPPATSNLYAWHTDGTIVAGEWPTWYRTGAIYGAIAAGDLDGDGVANVITGRDHTYLYAYAADGTLLPGWPITPFVNGNDGDWSTDLRITTSNGAPVIADLDGDGVREYIIAGNVKHPDDLSTVLNSALLVLNPDGLRRPGWETAALGNGILYQDMRPQQAPAIADLDQDGQFEIVVATYDGWIRAYKPDQSILWAFDFAQGDIIFASEAVIGDIDGDQALEIIFGTYDPLEGSGPVGVWGLEADGTPIPGYPLAISTPGIRAAPTLSDLDSDGELEIVAAAWTGEIFIWDTPAPYVPSQLPWPTGRHDLRRSATVERLEPDLSASHKFVIHPAPRQGETVDFVIRLHNTGARPFTQPLRLTDTLPAGMTYVPDSLAASLGVVIDTGGLLRWGGIMSNTAMVDITYAVTITTDAMELLVNIATLDVGVDEPIIMAGYVLANGQPSYLPLVTKN